MSDARGPLAPGYISDEELARLEVELQDRRHYAKGPDGFERPLYVSPAKWDQVQALVRELMVRRKERRNGR